MEPKLNLSAEITRFQKLQSALELPEDQIFHAALQEKIDAYKKQITFSKPLDDQIQSQQANIKRKKDKIAAAQANIDEQQQFIDKLNLKLPTLEQELAELQQRKLAEVNPHAEAQAAAVQLAAAHAEQAALMTQQMQQMA